MRGQITMTSYPASRNAQASCQTLRSSGTGRFSTRMRMAGFDWTWESTSGPEARNAPPKTQGWSYHPGPIFDFRFPIYARRVLRGSYVEKCVSAYSHQEIRHQDTNARGRQPRFQDSTSLRRRAYRDFKYSTKSCFSPSLNPSPRKAL